MSSVDKWKVVKYIAFAIIVLMFVVLVVQYVNLGGLSRENARLSSELNSVSQELAGKEQKKEEIEKNYNQFVEDEAKEKYDMKNQNEDVIKAK